MERKKSIRFLVQSATIAALYVALTFISSILGLSSGVIQIRFSEAMCILPMFTTAAVPGLFIGCMLANTLTGSIFIDIVCGSLATLIGALLTRYLRNHKFLAILSPILSNTIIIPFVLKFAYGFQGSVLYFMVTIAIGEVISCGLLGYILYKAMKNRTDIF